MTGLPRNCERCGAKLLPGKLIPVCEECKHICRSERLAANLRARAEAEAAREERRDALRQRIHDLDADKEGTT